MGEARRRGSYEQRKADAVERAQILAEKRAAESKQKQLDLVTRTSTKRPVSSVNPINRSRSGFGRSGLGVLILASMVAQIPDIEDIK